MFQIAVYGKGGIGKSTLSANISVALSYMGNKVMQIGCDPKYDSTRPLLNGHAQTTVLDYIANTPASERTLEDVAVKGTNGILCIEAGGPEPGIGCAGRGIISTMNTLKSLGADDADIDYRIYDVLGDVVCGGFAVPLRDEYADAVILVTSGEFMSLYAANNIMKGVLNFNADRPRVAGLVLNSKGMNREYQIVERFANATGIPIIATIPRSPLFSQAEIMKRTVLELFPDSNVAHYIRSIANCIADIKNKERMLYCPTPLNDGQMSEIWRTESYD